MNLENNSKEMKTVVETFVMEETVELTYDQESLDKWNAMVEELGLEGQEKVISPEKSPIPFMYMNQTLIEVAKTLCPRQVTVKSYDATPIPLDILELVAMSTREKYFTMIEIWYDEKSKDPFAIGITDRFSVREKDSYKTLEEHGRFRTAEDCKAYIKEHSLTGTCEKAWGETKHYLIGKWADVKMNFDQLTAKAKKRYISEESLRYERQMKEAKRGLADVQLTAEEKFGE